MNPVAFAVDDLREQYTREMALVRQTCERTGDGTAAIRRRSAVVDRILIEMWRRAFAGHPSQNISLLALGGYGRKDLFPYPTSTSSSPLPTKKLRSNPRRPSAPSFRA